MGRRYKRREFLTDAVVTAAVAVLLKICAPAADAAQPPTASSMNNPDNVTH
jgi:hypothetical protein